MFFIYTLSKNIYLLQKHMSKTTKYAKIYYSFYLFNKLIFFMN